MSEYVPAGQARHCSFDFIDGLPKVPGMHGVEVTQSEELVRPMGALNEAFVRPLVHLVHWASEARLVYCVYRPTGQLMHEYCRLIGLYLPFWQG